MTASSPQPPRLPGYTYSAPIEGGEGGYAKVFKYEQQAPHRTVAVKVLRAHRVAQGHYQEMLAEATAMAVLETHPHMVPVFEAKMSEDGQPCIIMMYCGGPNLMSLVTDHEAPGGLQRPLSVRRVVRLGVQIADVVQAAHDKGIVHRDIKPANILTDDRDSPRLTDFGIAARLDAMDDDAPFGLSLPWCPPEILAGKQGTVASDIFSLGATLWHLLAGRSPFDVPGRNSVAELEARVADPWLPAIGRTDVPRDLEQLLHRMMAKEPKERPRSASDVISELTKIERRIGVPTADEPWHVSGNPRAATPHVTPVPVHTADRVVARSVPPMPAPATRTHPHDAHPAAAVPVATRLKPREAASDEVHVLPVVDPPRRSARWVWVAGVVAVLLAMTVVGVVLRGTDQQAPTVQSSAGEGSDTGGGAGSQGDDVPPGRPTVTAVRVNASSLRFSWVYSAPLGTDSYLWRLAGEETTHSVDKPTVDVRSPRGTRVCIQVKVVRADGSYASVDWSDAGCGS